MKVTKVHAPSIDIRGSFVLQWTLACLVGGIGVLLIADILTYLLMSGLNYANSRGDNTSGPLLLWLLLMVGLLGPSLGIAQSRLLKEHLVRRDHIAWIVANALGVWLITLGTLIMLFTYRMPTEREGFFVLFASLSGFLIGTPQWIVLSRNVPAAGWWIVATGIATLSAFCAAWAVLTFVLPLESGIRAPFYPLSGFALFTMATAMGLLVYGVLTGLVLWQLLQAKIHAQ